MSKFQIRSTVKGPDPRDTTLVIEGGLPPDWDGYTDEDKARLFQQAAAPTAKATASRLRKFQAKPRDENDDDGIRYLVVRGGLPDWRHEAEHRAIARQQYEDAQKAKLAAPKDTLQGEVTTPVEPHPTPPADAIDCTDSEG
ncbi:hypothetical protein [Paraburkholderia sp. DHOC27]|uniref:hypothetical protein n=1 Tax=Paraburkholderia sp. DHOC27 TaxID=2303330 RepID=UPI000E3B6219|nr:hypothetical protein [Paraburkholderia sp. DHOC27]RFU48648.1 hypothetical protein D0B32_02075 [Paraburkholderia sp. DHOC27]